MELPKPLSDVDFEAIFRAEMTRVFGAVWVYLGHESEIPNNDDFVQTWLGLRPIILVRDSAGKIRALYNRCTHRGSTVCRQQSGSAKAFQCPYHGWTFRNNGEIAGVPWPEGYADDFSNSKFNLAQVPRVDSYKGFIFGTLNMAAPSLMDYLGPVATPLAEWVDRHPGQKVALCNANRLKLHGNWKLVYDNSADGYHVVFSHRSLLAMENRLAADGDKGMAFYKESPDTAPMYVYYFGNGHHFKDKRGNVERGRPGALWEIEGDAPDASLAADGVHYGDGSGDAIGCPSGAAPRIELRLDGSGKLSGAALRAATKCVRYRLYSAAEAAWALRSGHLDAPTWAGAPDAPLSVLEKDRRVAADTAMGCAEAQGEEEQRAAQRVLLGAASPELAAAVAAEAEAFAQCAAGLRSWQYQVEELLG